MDEQIILEGHISVGAALAAGSRPIHAIYIRKDKLDGAVFQIEQTAKARGLKVERVTDEQIASYATGTTHGGVIAVVGPRAFLPLEALATGRAAPFVIMIDGVEDPFNFGAAVRSLYAAGADGLVVRPRNWMSAAGVVARASAGASELIPTALAETALDAAAFFKQRRCAIACAAPHKRSASLYATDLTGPLFLLIGGEKRGITRSFIDQADLLLHIPYARADAHSLGTAAATAIIAFEVMRQRSHQTSQLGPIPFK